MAIAVTGIGVCSALGRGLDVHWEALVAGRQGHTTLAGLGASFDQPMPLARLPEALSQQAAADTPGVDPTTALAALVSRDALAQAGVDPAGLAVVVGTSNGGLHSRRDYRDADPEARELRLRLLNRSAVDQAAVSLGEVLGVTGPCVTVSTACASSTHGVGLALAWLRSGRLPAVLVVGVDLVLPMVASGFSALGVMGAQPCTPFSLPVGMSLGEGAAAWVLAAAPPGPARVWLRGFGSSADAVHPTAPDPSGAGVAHSLRAALADAQVPAAEVGLYSAQGTGTEANDAAETLAVLAVLGAEVPVTSAKGHLGHCQGAGGLLEASLALAGLQRQVLPPTTVGTSPRRLAPRDVVGPLPRPAAHRVVLKHSAAFGGANATLVLGLDPGPGRESTPALGHVVGSSLLAPAAPGGPLATPPRIGRVRLGPLDPTGRYLATAVAAARPAGGDDSWGLVAAVPGLQAASGTAWQDSVARQAASGRSFSRLVRNAGTGAACQALRLHGPTSTLCSGSGSGLLALLHALDLLQMHPDAAGVLAAAADEVGPNTRDRAALDPTPRPPLAELAAAVAVGRRGGVPVAGTGLAGPGELSAAIRQALGATEAMPDSVWGGSDGSPAASASEQRALVDVGLDGVPWTATSDTWGLAPATLSLAAVVAAATAVGSGAITRALVIAVQPGGFAAAVLLGPRGYQRSRAP